MNILNNVFLGGHSVQLVKDKLKDMKTFLNTTKDIKYPIDKIKGQFAIHWFVRRYNEQMT